jgi:WD40 repeat protein
LRLWDAVTSVHLNTLVGHVGAVILIVFSPDGTRVLSGSNSAYESLLLWDVVSGKNIHKLSGHTGCFTSAAFSQDGRRVVCGYDGGVVYLWDVVNGVYLKTLKGHKVIVRSVAFSPDDAHIVSVSIDSAVRLWDAASGAHLDTSTGHPKSAASITYFLNSPQSSLSESDLQVVASKAADPTFGYTMEGGWIYSVRISKTRRLCWIPVSCRPNGEDQLVWYRQRVALGTEDGRVIMLDFKGMGSYLDNLSA